MIYDSPGGSVDQRFRVLPNYFGSCVILLYRFSATTELLFVTLSNN